MTPCPICEERLIEYVLDEIGDSERTALETHLAVSADCAHEAERLRQTVAASFRRGDEEPSPALLAGLKAEARKQAAEQRAHSTASERALRRERVARSEPARRRWLAAIAGAFRRSVTVPAWVPALGLLLVTAGIYLALHRQEERESGTEVATLSREVRDQSAPARTAAKKEAEEKQQPSEDKREDRPAPATPPPLASPPPPAARPAVETDDRRLRAIGKLDAMKDRSETSPGERDGERRIAEPVASEPEGAALAKKPAVASPAAAPVAEVADGAGAASDEGRLGAAGGTVPPAVPGSAAAVVAALHRGDAADVAAAYDAWRRSETPAAAPAEAPAKVRPEAAGRSALAAAAAGSDASGPDGSERQLLAQAEAAAGQHDGPARAAALTLLLRLGRDAGPAVAARALAASVPLAIDLGDLDQAARSVARLEGRHAAEAAAARRRLEDARRAQAGPGR